jgi:hypothetical protein
MSSTYEIDYEFTILSSLPVEEQIRGQLFSIDIKGEGEMSGHLYQMIKIVKDAISRLESVQKINSFVKHYDVDYVHYIDPRINKDKEKLVYRFNVCYDS